MRKSVYLWATCTPVAQTCMHMEFITKKVRLFYYENKEYKPCRAQLFHFFFLFNKVVLIEVIAKEDS